MLAAITGASSGIGAAFARQLAQRGWDLLLIARREDRLRELATYLAAHYNIQAEPLPADLTCPEALAAVAGRIREASKLGLLVNNAGFGTRGYFFETETGPLLSMHRLHVEATVALTQAALANLYLRAQKGTGVINVSSVAAFLPAASYGATKTWMNAFTESVATELAALKSPVVLQALCPGFTLTEFHDVIAQDRSAVPFWMWLPPDFVVSESLKGFERGQLVVVPGWRYRVLAWSAKQLPAKLRRQVLLKLVPRYKQPKN